MNKRGVVLIICYMVIAVLAILGAAFLIRSVSERSVAGKYFDSTQALWLAEAGVNQAIFQLRNNYNDSSGIAATSLGGKGEYKFDPIVKNLVDDSRTITAHGFVPSEASATRVERVIKATMIKRIPPDFYYYAIYSAGDVSIGNNCVVNGDIFSGGTVTGSANGDITQNDPTLKKDGLPLLSFDELKKKSIEQGWYNDVTGETTYPDSFWNVVPTPPDDPGKPNVVFVNGDFTLVGGNQVVNGFIVVGGNTIYNAEIGGNASINGCLYTRGDIWFHGGGGKVINVDGGIWAGGTVIMDGNEQINYDPPGHGKEYMDAIEKMKITADVQVTSWREL